MNSVAPNGSALNLSRKRHGWINRIAAAPLWAIVAATLLLQAGAYLIPDSFRSTSKPLLMASWIELFAGWFRPHLGVLCLACALLGLLLRRGRLAVLGLTLGLIGIAPVASVWLPKRVSGPVQGTPLVLASMNLQGENRDGDRIVAGIRAADPDVLLIQEFTPFQQELLQKALAGDYPNRLLFPHDGYDGMAVYSRLPVRLESPPAINVPGWPSRVVKAVLRVNGQDVALWSVHLMAVSNLDQVERNRHETADLVDAVRGETRQLILSGDCNFTDTTANAAALESSGLTDTQRLAGSGRRVTWPSSGWGWRIGVRIDHVYVTRQFACTSDTAGDETGSDHRPIAVRLVLQP
jgi:endonuclease/exonuclease/phosphatase (EEP) superfamily protein YafD